MRNTTAALLAATLAGLALTEPSAAQSPQERGRAIAQMNCARCHSIEREGPSPMPVSVPFRELPKRYPVEQLGEALAEGIVTGHPEMPEFSFEPRQIEALLAYIETLNQKSP